MRANDAAGCRHAGLTLPPFPLEDLWPGLFRGGTEAGRPARATSQTAPENASSGSSSISANSESAQLAGAAPTDETSAGADPPGGNAALYLDVAERVVDVALNEWWDGAGQIIDPFETSDRWRGGTAARFACPAAILAHLRARHDLIAPACLALDQLTAAIATATAANAPPFIPGVLDLTAKEIMLARNHLAPLVPPERVAVWDRAWRDLDPDTAYTAAGKHQRGARPNNYEAYASVGEWLRHRAGLADTEAWIERVTEWNLPWTTPHGLYRDPDDPAAYDLSVRQNWSELLYHGYRGPSAARLDELLRRGGITMLLTISPLGWAPFGGRSNLFVHNEGMIACIAACEARRWRQWDRPEVAGAFQLAGRQAARVAREYYGATPLRNLKNNFAPVTKHGRDTRYGEYAVYSLLGASLFARAASMVDDDTGFSPAPVGNCGTLLHLYPEFHRTFASCGDTQVQIDTRAQLAHDATGVGRMHRLGVPPALGMSCSVAPEASYIVSRGRHGRALAIGPAWRTASGDWQSLAQLSNEIAGVRCETHRIDATAVEWTLVHYLQGQPVQSVRQRYRLTPGCLHIRVETEGRITATAMEIPCLCHDGASEADIEAGAQSVAVRFHGARLLARGDHFQRVHLDDEEYASRQAVYRAARLESSGSSVAVDIDLRRTGER